MFATVALLSNERQNGRHQRACAQGEPADQLCIVSMPSARPHFHFDCLGTFSACVAGVRNFKNLLLINQKIYVHGWVFVCYQYRVFSLRDASCNVSDIEIMCRTFGSVIVVLFPICSFARGKGSLETMIYLTVFDCCHVFRSTLKLS